MTDTKQAVINELTLITKTLIDTASILDRLTKIVANSNDIENGVPDKDWQDALAMLRLDVISAEWESARIIDEMKNTLISPKIKAL